MIDPSGVAFDTENDALLVLSHERSRVQRVVPDTGEILEQRDLKGSPQYEGITRRPASVSGLGRAFDADEEQVNKLCRQRDRGWVA
jgi:hypothetical protein